MLSLWFFGRRLNIPINLSRIGSIRGLLPFSGVMFKVLRSVSKFVHLRSTSFSPTRIPFSCMVWSAVDKTVPVPDTSMSISCSVGMKGNLSCGV